MKCLHCPDKKMRAAKIDYPIQIVGGPSLIVKGIEVFQCPQCKDPVIDSAVSATINKMVLSSLFTHYWPLEKAMPGSVATWIRKAVGMSNSDLARLSGQSPATVTQSEKRNSTVDSLAKLHLLIKTADFVTGSTIGSDCLRVMLSKVGEVVHDRGDVDSVEYLEAAG